MTPQESGKATAFAPATVANMGPGFDLLGLALESPGDTVSLTLVSGARGVSLGTIEGDGGRLPLDPEKNTAAVAVSEVLQRAGLSDRVSVEIHLRKGLPLGSGLGSSGASAVAAAIAVNSLLESPLGISDLLAACRQAEAVACGVPHGDNVAPALLGGIVLLPPGECATPISLPVPDGLCCAVAHPDLEINTEQARSLLPRQVPLEDVVFNMGQVATLISALYDGDINRLSSAIEDRIVTPARSGLIPGFSDICQAARDSGAIAAGISGSGPTVFALATDRDIASSAAEAMVRAFGKEGIHASAWSTGIASNGARLVDSSSEDVD